MFSINLQGGIPIYEQLFSRISELIVGGGLAENEKLPAVREVAKELGINPNTVQKTYQALEAAGLIYSIPAKGSYVAKLDFAIDSIREKALAEFEKAAENALKQGVTPEKMRNVIDVIEKKTGEEKGK